MKTQRDRIIICQNCERHISHEDIKICSNCSLSACKHCVPGVNCPDCGHEGTMHKPEHHHILPK